MVHAAAGSVDVSSSRSSAFSLADELGLRVLFNSHRDVKILCLQRFVRHFAFGTSMLVLTLYLTGLGHTKEAVGLFMTLTLLGDVVLSLALTLVADRVGRKALLALGSLLMVIAGVAFATISNLWILLAASIIGIISPK